MIPGTDRSVNDNPFVYNSILNIYNFIYTTSLVRPALAFLPTWKFNSTLNFEIVRAVLTLYGRFLLCTKLVAIDDGSQ